jgi:hypothetical protein
VRSGILQQRVNSQLHLAVKSLLARGDRADLSGAADATRADFAAA